MDEWPFFGTLVHNLELAVVKADLHAAREYQTLSDKTAVETFWPRIQKERQVLEGALGQLSGGLKPLSSKPRLARAAAWRNPQVDALNHLQVELLSEYRESGDEALLPLLAQTMEGIALGVRSSG